MGRLKGIKSQGRAIMGILGLELGSRRGRLQSRLVVVVARRRILLKVRDLKGGVMVMMVVHSAPSSLSWLWFPCRYELKKEKMKKKKKIAYGCIYSLICMMDIARRLFFFFLLLLLLPFCHHYGLLLLLSRGGRGGGGARMHVAEA